jgi:hypothetical protein
VGRVSPRATIARGVSLPLPNNVFSTSMIGRVMSRQPLKRSWGGERKKRPRRSRASADGSLPAANIDRFRENPMPTSAGDILSVGQPGRGSIQIAKEAGLRRPQYICRTRYIARLCVNSAPVLPLLAGVTQGTWGGRFSLLGGSSGVGPCIAARTRCDLSAHAARPSRWRVARISRTNRP